MEGIILERVGKSYGGFQALKDVSHTMKKGQVTVLIGPSGSGKSTLVRCLNGLEQISSGAVYVDGTSVFDKKTNLNKLRSRIGMVFQQFNLYPHMTVLKNVTLAPLLVSKVAPDAARRKALELLERVHIADQADKYPAQLSGGQQQRVAIARALAMEPSIMLFDEPTSALDPEMISEVLDVMTDLARDGMTMVIVTHELGFARQVANEIVFMEKGRIVEIGSPSEIFLDSKDERTRKFINSILH